MKVYVVFIEDRHAEVDVELFHDREAALTRARAIVEEYVHDPEDITEMEITKHMADAKWIYYCIYSCEGDDVRVLEKEFKD